MLEQKTLHCPHQKQHTPAAYKQCLGAIGEQVVADWCTAHNWQILARNLRSRHGEIDLIITDNTAIAAVEVKTRTNQNSGHPLEAITPLKLLTIKKVLREWITKNPSRKPLRIDVAAVIIQGGTQPKIEYLSGIENV